MPVYNDERSEKASTMMSLFQSSRKRRQRHQPSSSSSSCWYSSRSFSYSSTKVLLLFLCLFSWSPKTTMKQWTTGGGGGGFFAAAQELPSIQVPQFSTNVTFRQDVCERYRLYSEGQLDLRYALQGIQLRPIIRLNQFFRLDESRAIDKGNPGLVAIILDEISRRGKFTWRETFAVSGRPEEGKSFTELLVWGTDHYDVFCSWWDITLERLQKGVAFPEGWNDGSYILVGRDETLVDEKQKQSFFSSIDLWNWLAPFDIAVWLLTAFTVLASGLLYHWLDHLDLNPDLKKRPQKYKLRWTSCYLSFLTFTQHYQFVPRSHPARLIGVSLAFWSLLVSATYTANLASFFVVNNVPTINIDSIESAIKHGQVICVFKGAAVDNYITDEYPKALINRKETEIETYEAVRDGECDVVAAQYSTWQKFESDSEVNRDCSLKRVGRSIKNLRAGFATAADSGTLCTSLIRDVLNVHLVEMLDDGFLELAWETYLRREQDLDCEVEREVRLENADDESASLGIREMAGTFLMHWVMCALAVVCALASKIYNRGDPTSLQPKQEQQQLQLKLQHQQKLQQSPPDVNRIFDDDNNDNSDQEKGKQLSSTSTLSLFDMTKLFPIGDQIMRSNRTNFSHTASVTKNINNDLFELDESTPSQNDDNDIYDESNRSIYFANTPSSLDEIKNLPLDLQVKTMLTEQHIQSTKQDEMARMQITLLHNQQKLIEQHKKQMEQMANLIQSFQKQSLDECDDSDPRRSK